MKVEKDKEKHSDKENKDNDIGIEIENEKCKDKETDKDKENEMDCEVEKDIIDNNQKILLEPFSATPVTLGISTHGKEKEKEKEKGKESDIENQYVCVGSMKRPAMSLTRFLRETEKRRRAVVDGVIHN